MRTDHRTVGPPRSAGHWSDSALVAVIAIWASSAFISVAAPDMVSGSEQEHLPLAMLTVWLWAAAATTYALMTPIREVRTGWAYAVSALWVITALVAVLSPELVTGSDPTRIPLAALVAPPVAAIATGVLALRQANVRV